ncbi:BrnT family toxin [Massilia sp. erpn]|uniref:BrnT family toxin n=1 Tax=Massilia sp. erpn TaxID=2738142 RepID=UPI0021051B65|nr:BrnT family toxin [Massilia sp. erpn]
MEMEIEFDAAKNAANRRKHGVPLSLAAQLDWDHAVVWPDPRYAYDEQRMAALLPSLEAASRGLYFAVFVERGKSYRMISLRYANRKEKLKYDHDYY